MFDFHVRNDLWAPSYYVGTAGNVSAEAIKNYVEETKNL
jgi:putative transposase